LRNEYTTAITEEKFNAADQINMALKAVMTKLPEKPLSNKGKGRAHLA